MYKPYMTCQNFTIARTKILRDDKGIAVVHHACRESEVIGVDESL